MIISADFDGTIVENKFPNIGPLLPNAKEVINKLSDKFTFILWTCRSGVYLQEAIDFIKTNDINIRYFNENAPLVKFDTGRKIFSDYYIDDRNLGFEVDWLNIYEQLSKIEIKEVLFVRPEDEFRFGKYKGCTIGEVRYLDKQYITWAKQNKVILITEELETVLNI